ncbi:MAG: histidine kinase [Pyrinomonadaceae bacterium]
MEIVVNSPNSALLINLLGFTVGAALYALLAWMVIRQRRAGGRVTALLLATSALGLLWNLGELFLFLQHDLAAGRLTSPYLTAASYAALGFLPTVVVHSAQREGGRALWLTYAAYGLSIAAASLHFYSAAERGVAPSETALRTLSAGAVALAASLLFSSFRETRERKLVWASSLLVFAVSSFHLSGRLEGSSWLVELIAHQSSIPIALVILLQNYRFAFADLFLKRAISLMLLALLAFGLYVYVAAPLLRYHETHDRNDALAIGLILTLWMTTALVYPALHRFAKWIVDRAILQRRDYQRLQVDLAREIGASDSIEDILELVRSSLGAALTAGRAEVVEVAAESEGTPLIHRDAASADSVELVIPTAEPPFYRVDLAKFKGGRRLLSDESAMLEAVALLTARRIDAVRVSQERFEREFREREMSRLATEAQLKALRSQIDPHFLFNSLTTIGYLIQTAPERALETLMQLTRLLRRVLSSSGEFCTLREEIDLIENYLEIERARFEEKLRVTIDVPRELAHCRIPSLILQPLVENAIKHGISENRNGGELRISASTSEQDDGRMLVLSVEDSGAGTSGPRAAATTGLGLQNVRERLRGYYGPRAALNVEIDRMRGTRAEARLPVRN